MRLPISPRLSFNFAIPCHKKENLWTKEAELSWQKVGLNLEDKYILPQFNALEGKQPPVEVRMAWDESGLAMAFIVTGKKRPLDCRVPLTDSGDSVQLWLDTRDMRQVHRAARSCHQFAIFPTGGGRKLNEAVLLPVPIHLAKENPKNMEASYYFTRSEINTKGYILECVFPAESLTDFRPDDYPTLGIAWEIQDRDLGDITLSAPSPAPFQSDPAFWCTLNLV